MKAGVNDGVNDLLVEERSDRAQRRPLHALGTTKLEDQRVVIIRTDHLKEFRLQVVSGEQRNTVYSFPKSTLGVRKAGSRKCSVWGRASGTRRPSTIRGVYSKYGGAKDCFWKSGSCQPSTGDFGGFFGWHQLLWRHSSYLRDGYRGRAGCRLTARIAHFSIHGCQWKRATCSNRSKQ